MCPMCGKRYQAWEHMDGSEAIMAANKAYIYPSSVGEDLNKLENDNGNWAFTLVQWQDSAAGELCNKLKQVHQDLTTRLAGLSKAERYKEVLRHLSEHPVHAAFTQLHLEQGIRDMVSQANAGRATAANAKLWDYRRLEDGFYGCQLPAAAATMRPLSQMGFLYSMAETFWLAHHAGAIGDAHIPYASRSAQAASGAASSSGAAASSGQ